MYNQYVPVNQLQRSDQLVEEQIRHRQARQRFHVTYEQNRESRIRRGATTDQEFQQQHNFESDKGDINNICETIIEGNNSLDQQQFFTQQSQADSDYIQQHQHLQPGQTIYHQNHGHHHVPRLTKVIIAANRLPVTLKRDPETGQWAGTKSSGGLVSGLSAVRGFEMVWIGWPGAEIPIEERGEVQQILKSHNCYPVWLSQELINLYYNGFANNVGFIKLGIGYFEGQKDQVIWPLFHYVMPPLPLHGVNESTHEQWKAYQKANEMFTDCICDIYCEDDYVWVHDYHLMLVPKFLRDRIREANIGWFLHTPFPASEYYRVLKVREELLHGVLSANLVAFHVYDYIRHFLSSVVQLTSLETAPTGVDATPNGGCFVKCGTIPIGIEPKQFTDSLKTEEVQHQMAILREQFGDRKIILGVDRLDYMKGIPHKLRAFDRFLQDHPEWVSQCVLVQVAVPSRGDVAEYQKLKKIVHESVGDICGRHSSFVSGPPVVYLDQSIDHDQLAALYRAADVCLITSIRDGMNLVSHEFVACQEGKHGVLILSEFAGAAQSLGAGSIRVNPWNLRETADAIHKALVMGPEERAARHEYAWQIIHKYTAQKWAETFIQTLKEACVESEEIVTRVPPLLPYEIFLDEISRSRKRLLLIDLLDCLVPSKVKKNLPMKLYQSLLIIPSQILQCLAILARDPNTTIVIVTMHQRGVLERLFGHLPLILAAENGCTYRGLDGEWRTVVDEEVMQGAEEWMQNVSEVFTYFKERTPGSYTERQEYSLQWYYDNTQSDFGNQQVSRGLWEWLGMARELLIYLWSGPLINSEAEVVLGNRAIQVRPHGCSRGSNIVSILRNELAQNNTNTTGDEAQAQTTQTGNNTNIGVTSPTSNSNTQQNLTSNTTEVDFDFCACFAEVPFRDDGVFDALENFLIVGDDNSEEEDDEEEEDNDQYRDVPQLQSQIEAQLDNQVYEQQEGQMISNITSEQPALCITKNYNVGTNGLEDVEQLNEVSSTNVLGALGTTNLADTGSVNHNEITTQNVTNSNTANIALSQQTDIKSKSPDFQSADSGVMGAPLGHELSTLQGIPEDERTQSQTDKLHSSHRSVSVDGSDREIERKVLILNETCFESECHLIMLSQEGRPPPVYDTAIDSNGDDSPTSRTASGVATPKSGKSVNGSQTVVAQNEIQSLAAPTSNLVRYISVSSGGGAVTTQSVGVSNSSRHVSYDRLQPPDYNDDTYNSATDIEADNNDAITTSDSATKAKQQFASHVVAAANSANVLESSESHPSTPNESAIGSTELLGLEQSAPAVTRSSDDFGTPPYPQNSSDVTWTSQKQEFKDPPAFSATTTMQEDVLLKYKELFDQGLIIKSAITGETQILPLSRDSSISGGKRSSPAGGPGSPLQTRRISNTPERDRESRESRDTNRAGDRESRLRDRSDNKSSRLKSPQSLDRGRRKKRGRNSNLNNSYQQQLLSNPGPGGGPGGPGGSVTQLSTGAVQAVTVSQGAGNPNFNTPNQARGGATAESSDRKGGDSSVQIKFQKVGSDAFVDSGNTNQIANYSNTSDEKNFNLTNQNNADESNSAAINSTLTKNNNMSSSMIGQDGLNINSGATSAFNADNDGSPTDRTERQAGFSNIKHNSNDASQTPINVSEQRQNQGVCFNNSSMNKSPSTHSPPSEATDRGITYFSVSLGRRMSRAKYSLPNPYHLQSLLRSMVDRLGYDVEGINHPGEGCEEYERSRAVLVGPESENPGKIIS